MSTEINTQVYGVVPLEKDVQQVNHTNGTTRTQVFGELVVAEVDGKAFIGFVAEIDGIAPDAEGMINLFEGNVIATDQIDTEDTFVKDQVGVYITKQTNDSAAVVKDTADVGLWPLNALVTKISNGVGGHVRLRMPAQDGSIVVVPGEDREVTTINHTNGTTRTQVFGELVVVEKNSQAFIGFVAEIDGIAPEAEGSVDLFDSAIVITDQIDTADTFVKDQVGVFILKQTNSAAAVVKDTTATNLFPLNALVTAINNGVGGDVHLRMPPQDGSIEAAS